MRKLYEMKTVEKDSHHMFTYEDGRKTPIPDDGVVFCYLTETGMLKTTEWLDRAGSVEGRFVVTDEITSDHGKPRINGHTYDIFGANDEGVYLTAAKDELFHTYDYRSDKKTVNYSPNNPDKQSELEQLRQIYMMLK